MHADKDTVCAGLLHDTLEDTHITKEEIQSIDGLKEKIDFLFDVL